MQALARDGLSDAQVLALLTGPLVDVTRYGCEVLDLSGTVLGDLADGTAPGKRIGHMLGDGGDIEGCVITHDVSLPVPTNCKIQIGRELDWENVRVRPWQEIGPAGKAARFYLGLYGLEAPTASPSEGIFDVQGYDVLAAFRIPQRRSRWIDVGVSYTQAMRDWIDGMAIPGVTHRIDSSSDSVLTDVQRCWALNASSPDLELNGINDLATAVGYTPLAPDELGVLRSVPYRAPSERASEWLYDLDDDAQASIVDVVYSAKRDALAAANWWRGVRRDMASRPTEGAGIYTVDRSAGGRVVPSWGTYDVASQDALKALVDAQVVVDTTSRLTVEITTDAMPQLGHDDIVTVKSSALDLNDRAQIVWWQMDLAQAETTQRLGVL